MNDRLVAKAVKTTPTAKRAVNVSVRSDLVDAARESGINLSQMLEAALQTELKTRRQATWLEENAAAIAAYNAYVKKNGLWCDGMRDEIWSSLAK